MADEQKKSGFFSDLFAPVGGFGVTFSTMFRKVATEEYPEEKRPTQPRFHGRHQLNRHPDGLEKCVGCELCAWACPADAILVEGANNDDSDGGAGRFSWWRPWKRGAVGRGFSGYSSVATLRNIVENDTPKPATGAKRSEKNPPPRSS